MNEDLLKGFDAWLDYRRASFEYQVTLGETWIHAFEEIMRRLVTQAEKGRNCSWSEEAALSVGRGR